MASSPIDIPRLANLARLDISAAESEAVRAKLEAILGMVSELQAVDTAGVQPMAHAQDVAAPLREDRVTDTDRHAQYQSVAPAVENGLYLVPKVLE